jgi:hypothetical protein
MWICPVCNQLVPNRVKRKCPNGHLLFDMNTLGPTTEKPALRSFVNEVLVCLGVFVAVTSINDFVPSKPLGNALGYALVFLMAYGVVALMRAFKWRRKGGALLRLVPRAAGIGLGCLLAGGGLFALGSALGLIH